MTEAEWNDCSDPLAMLDFLRRPASDRKLRLFACACCRRVWSLLTNEGSRQAIRVAEDFADGRAAADALDEAEAEAEDVYQQINLDRGESEAGSSPETAAYAAWLASSSYWRDPHETHAYLPDDAKEAASAVVDSLGENPGRLPSERRHQADLLRCIVGNPFRPVELDTAWLAYSDAAVVKIATVVYEERAWDRIPILADALEDAGCANTDILEHCRGPGPHVRGCWVVDLLLGKE